MHRCNIVGCAFLRHDTHTSLYMAQWSCKVASPAGGWILLLSKTEIIFMPYLSQTWLALTNNGWQYGTKVHQYSPSWMLFLSGWCLFAIVFPCLPPMAAFSGRFRWWQYRTKSDIWSMEERWFGGILVPDKNLNRHFMLFPASRLILELF